MRKATGEKVPPREIVTAVLVDGGFYRKRAAALLGKKDPEERAEELLKYCKRHIRQSRAGLYRIYYYDCPPSDKVVYHPLTKAHVNLDDPLHVDYKAKDTDDDSDADEL